MCCQAASELMSLRLDSLLSDEQEARLQEHLSRCEACRVEWAYMLRACSMFDGVVMEPPPVGLSTWVRRRIKRRRAWLSVFRIGVVLLLGVVVLAASGFTSVSMAATWIARNPAMLQALLGPLVRLVDVAGTLWRVLASAIGAAVTLPSVVGCIAGLLIVVALSVQWLRLVAHPPRTGLSRAR